VWSQPEAVPVTIYVQVKAGACKCFQHCLYISKIHFRCSDGSANLGYRCLNLRLTLTSIRFKEDGRRDSLMQSSVFDCLCGLAVEPDSVCVFLTCNICRDGNGKLIGTELLKQCVAERLILERCRPECNKWLP